MNEDNYTKNEPTDTEHTTKKDVGKEPSIYRLERSAIFTIIGVIILFASSIIVTLIAPRYVDSTWTTPSSSYQVQMYEIVDPHIYMRNQAPNNDLQYVMHLNDGFTLLAFVENDNLQIVAPPELEKFITHTHDNHLKLTSRLLLLRTPTQQETNTQLGQLQVKKTTTNATDAPSDKQSNKPKKIMELYDPQKKEAFSFDADGGPLQDWVDQNFEILDDKLKQPYHGYAGVVYVKNPQEFLIEQGNGNLWQYDQNGKYIKDVAELTGENLRFQSRQKLIADGEHLYAIEGCWYCHTDQTRTLIHDTVLNGTDDYPAPPSSANEYIYQKITFPGTRRVGPDISRVAIKRPSRHWHQIHFWNPRTASVGSIMPAFKHYFKDNGANSQPTPNEKFEAIYQYLMTKGSRITAPTQAWWLGKDPINTKEIIEGQRKL